jgi:hypothetical protein
LPVRRFGDDTFFFAAFGVTNPSPVHAPDSINDFDSLGGDDRLDLGEAANATNFVNTGTLSGPAAQPRTTLLDAIAQADEIMNGTVIYVAVGYQPGPAAPSTLVFWDCDADGDADEAILLDGFARAGFGADDIV